MTICHITHRRKWYYSWFTNEESGGEFWESWHRLFASWKQPWKVMTIRSKKCTTLLFSWVSWLKLGVFNASNNFYRKLLKDLKLCQLLRVIQTVHYFSKFPDTGFGNVFIVPKFAIFAMRVHQQQIEQAWTRVEWSRCPAPSDTNNRPVVGEKRATRRGPEQF